MTKPDPWAHLYPDYPARTPTRAFGGRAGAMIPTHVGAPPSIIDPDGAIAAARAKNPRRPASPRPPLEELVQANTTSVLAPAGPPRVAAWRYLLAALCHVAAALFSAADAAASFVVRAVCWLLGIQRRPS
jgi:hypothetical protein